MLVPLSSTVINPHFIPFLKLGDLYPANKKSKLDETSPSRSPDLTPTAIGGGGGDTALRCDKCNISFKKLETFKVHKESYCESRHANVEAIQAARAEKQREREEMKLVNKVSFLTLIDNIVLIQHFQGAQQKPRGNGN